MPSEADRLGIDRKRILGEYTDIYNGVTQGPEPIRSGQAASGILERVTYGNFPTANAAGTGPTILDTFGDYYLPAARPAQVTTITINDI